MKERNTEPKRKEIIVQQRKAFTLVEVLIVGIIIGILAAMTYPQFKGFYINAKLKEVPNIVEIVRVAEQRYYCKHGHYFSFGLGILDGPLAGEPEAGPRGYTDGEDALFIIIPKGADAFCDHHAEAVYGGVPLAPTYLRIRFWKKGESGIGNQFYYWEYDCATSTITTHKDGSHEYAPYIEADVTD